MVSPIGVNGGLAAGHRVPFRLADKPAQPYGIERHRHLFAAWAAGRAPSVAGCRFKIEQGLDILESCGFDEDFTTPARLPAPPKTDVCHRAWRRRVVSQAARHNLTFTHGVAAKLINCYLKSRLVWATGRPDPTRLDCGDG